MLLTSFLLHRFAYAYPSTERRSRSGKRFLFDYILEKTKSLFLLFFFSSLRPVSRRRIDEEWVTYKVPLEFLFSILHRCGVRFFSDRSVISFLSFSLSLSFSVVLSFMPFMRYSTAVFPHHARSSSILSIFHGHGVSRIEAETICCCASSKRHWDLCDEWVNKWKNVKNKSK